jgi:hypothetical protein
MSLGPFEFAGLATCCEEPYNESEETEEEEVVVLRPITEADPVDTQVDFAHIDIDDDQNLNPIVPGRAGAPILSASYRDQMGSQTDHGVAAPIEPFDVRVVDSPADLRIHEDSSASAGPPKDMNPG